MRRTTAAIEEALEEDRAGNSSGGRTIGRVSTGMTVIE